MIQKSYIFYVLWRFSVYHSRYSTVEVNVIMCQNVKTLQHASRLLNCFVNSNVCHFGGRSVRVCWDNRCRSEVT